MASEERRGHPREAHREIITRAVWGIGERAFRYSRVIEAAEDAPAERILGTSLTAAHGPEAQSAAADSGGGRIMVPVTGSFNVNIWYSCDGSRDTRVVKETIRYAEVIPVEFQGGEALGAASARAFPMGEPRCLSASVEPDGRLRVELEVAAKVEVEGDTRITVQVYSGTRD